MFRFRFEIFEDSTVNSLIWMDYWVPYSISQRYHHEEKLLLVCSRSNKTTSTERILVLRRVTVPNAAMPPEVGPNHHQHQRRILDSTDTTLSDSELTNIFFSLVNPAKRRPPYLRRHPRAPPCRRGGMAGSSSRPALRAGRAYLGMFSFLIWLWFRSFMRQLRLH